MSTGAGGAYFYFSIILPSLPFRPMIISTCTAMLPGISRRYRPRPLAGAGAPTKEARDADYHFGTAPSILAADGDTRRMPIGAKISAAIISYFSFSAVAAVDAISLDALQQDAAALARQMRRDFSVLGRRRCHYVLPRRSSPQPRRAGSPPEPAGSSTSPLRSFRRETREAVMPATAIFLSRLSYISRCCSPADAISPTMLLLAKLSFRHLMTIPALNSPDVDARRYMPSAVFRRRRRRALR